MTSLPTTSPLMSDMTLYAPWKKKRRYSNPATTDVLTLPQVVHVSQQELASVAQKLKIRIGDIVSAAPVRLYFASIHAMVWEKSEHVGILTCVKEHRTAYLRMYDTQLQSECYTFECYEAFEWQMMDDNFCCFETEIGFVHFTCHLLIYI